MGAFTLKNGVAVLQDARRFGLVQHMLKHGRIAVSDVAKVLGVGGYSAAHRHVEMLTRANVVGIEQELRPDLNRTVKFLVLTDDAPAAFAAQKRAFKELAAA
jgi:predicted ArsR family transcriptional regulator